MDMKCKKCNSIRLNKSGVAKVGNNRYQRYYCKDCYRVSLYKIADVTKEMEAPVCDSETSIQSVKRCSNDLQ